MFFFFIDRKMLLDEIIPPFRVGLDEVIFLLKMLFYEFEH